MASVVSVTKENFSQMEQRALQKESARKKNILIRNLCMPLGNFIFTVCFFLCTFGVMYSVGDPAEVAAISELKLPTKLWTDFVARVPAELDWYWVVLIGVAASVVVSFAVCLIASLVVRLIPGKQEQGSTSEIELNKAKSLVERCVRINDYFPTLKFSGKKLTSALNLCSTVAFFVYCIWKTGQVNPEDLESLSTAVLVGMIFATAIFFVAFLLVRSVVIRLIPLLYSAKRDPDLEKAAKAYLKECEKLDKEEKERLKAKYEREQKIQRDREKQENMAKGAEIYAEAMAQETPDEKLISKAADLGAPDACLHVGRKLVGDWSSGMYTSKEKAGLLKRAVRYLENATGTVEGEFLWLFARANCEEHSASEWKAILGQIRSIHNGGKLPEEYTETCELTIQALVGLVDRTEEKEAAEWRRREQQRREKERREASRKCRCKFAAGAMCTYYSTSSYTSRCDYLNNPGQCAAALNNRALEFYYE